MKNTFKQVCNQKRADKKAFLIGEIQAVLFLIPVFIFSAWFSLATLADVVLKPTSSVHSITTYHQSPSLYIDTNQEYFIAIQSGATPDSFIEVIR